MVTKFVQTFYYKQSDLVEMSKADFNMTENTSHYH